MQQQEGELGQEQQKIQQYEVEVQQKILKKREDDPDHSGTITITTLGNEESIKLIIDDNGIGIPEKSLKTIFEPLYTIVILSNFPCSSA